MSENTTDRIAALIKYASAGNRIGILNMLGEEVTLDSQDENGQTALIAAVKNKKLETVKFLLSRGADMYITDNTGNSARTYAIKDDAILQCITQYEKYNTEERLNKLRNLENNPFCAAYPAPAETKAQKYKREQRERELDEACWELYPDPSHQKRTPYSE